MAGVTPKTIHYPTTSDRNRNRNKTKIKTNFPPLLTRQIEVITQDIPQVFKRNLCKLSPDNIQTVISYLNAVGTEIALSNNYKRGIIELLTRFARFHAEEIGNNNFKFQDITREDIIRFLISLKKTD